MVSFVTTRSGTDSELGLIAAAQSLARPTNSMTDAVPVERALFVPLAVALLGNVCEAPQGIASLFDFLAAIEADPSF